MTTGFVKDQNLEKQIKKQMGCMAGFLQLFDRHQILTAKRLPPSPDAYTTSDSEKSTEFENQHKPSPELAMQSPAAVIDLPPPKSPLPLPIFQSKQGTRYSWKFPKESPRLSLDSRATTDAKGVLHPKEIRTTTTSINRCDSIASDGSQQHRSSTSVIARLMGLEPLSNSTTSVPEKKPELQRSASESRVSKDLYQSQSLFNNAATETHNVDPRNRSNPLQNVNKVEPPQKVLNSSSQWRAPQHRKNHFDSGDVFPEPRQNVTIYTEIEKRLKMRGIDEQSKDLETLKEILEALQLKGLLHTRKSLEQNHRNFVYDESPIVVMKPSRFSTRSPSKNRTGDIYSPSSGGVRRAGEISPSVSPRRDRNVQSPTRSGRSPRPESNAGRSNSLVKPKPLTVETQRKVKESPENRRVSPVHSPKLYSRRTGPDQTANNPSPRRNKATAQIYQKEKITTVIVAEDESASNSGSSITTSTDTDRSKAEEYKEGRNLLERCDKLLNSIAEMNASDMQPSPVSVLDSSFYKDESFTPSPVTTKRNIDFKDSSSCELEDDLWSPVISPIRSKYEEISNDCDFIYISEILRASHYLPEDSDVFLLLEKQQYLKGNDTSKVSRMQRKLIFDTTNEILDRNTRLPPWKVVSWTKNNVTNLSLDKVWSEFQRIREPNEGEDLFEIICGVLKKDLAGDAVIGWGDCPVEMSEAILDIERLIFKDLISETIRDLAALASRTTLLSSIMPRRKLVF
ncbi:hypothetical protein ACJIZ3_011794 [Penstemon smallii]|uniref:DUF4378 domain-containing protein n=1 Tax=Penstemon smallii TaxID=265156 RepID=A0ABD3ULD7_9LAMI